MLKKIRTIVKIVKILITQYLKRLWNNIQGKKLTPFASGLREYVFLLLSSPEKADEFNGYKTSYENIIKECMRDNNFSREEALVQIFLLLSEYDDLKEGEEDEV